MNRTQMTIGAVASIATLAGTAAAEILVEIDLSVENQITVMATTGASSETVSFGDLTGIYFIDFYGVAGSPLSASLVSGDFTTFGDPTDNTPSLYRAGSGSDPGLNIWSFSSLSTVSVTAGQQAFQGSATWTVGASAYADMLAGASSGSIMANADSADDAGVIIGEYSVVPAPGALALLGLAGVAGRRRRN